MSSDQNNKFKDFISGGTKTGAKRYLHQQIIVFGVAIILAVGGYAGYKAWFEEKIEGEMTADEFKAVVAIENSSGVEDVMGHELGTFTILNIVKRVGEPPKCGLQTRGLDEKGQLINPMWNFVVLISDQGNVVFTNHFEGANGGAVEIKFANGHQYLLNKNMGDARRGIELKGGLLKDLKTGGMMTVTAGMLMGTPFSNQYDLSEIPSGLKYAKYFCLDT